MGSGFAFTDGWLSEQVSCAQRVVPRTKCPTWGGPSGFPDAHQPGQQSRTRHAPRGGSLAAQTMATGANTNRRSGASVRRFGSFELDMDAERLLKNGRIIRIQPQPFRLLCLLTNRPGALITREEIQAALWAGDTFVDFDQGVNFAIKQVREALGDRAEDSLYVQTVPKRGYRFLAPVEAGPEPAEPIVAGSVDPYLQKALWANIVELRLAEKRRNQQVIILTVVLALVVIILIALLVSR